MLSISTPFFIQRVTELIFVWFKENFSRLISHQRFTCLVFCSECDRNYNCCVHAVCRDDSSICCQACITAALFLKPYVVSCTVSGLLSFCTLIGVIMGYNFYLVEKSVTVQISSDAIFQSVFLCWPLVCTKMNETSWILLQWIPKPSRLSNRCSQRSVHSSSRSWTVGWVLSQYFGEKNMKRNFSLIVTMILYHKFYQPTQPGLCSQYL